MRLNTKARNGLARYFDFYRSQVAYFGTAGHRRLRESTVLVVGDGRVGHTVSLTLAATGVGRLIVVDPQRVASSDLNRCALTRTVDVGRWKVDTTAGLLEGRPFLQVIPIIGRAEQLDVLPDVHEADLVVAACNTIPGRLAVANFAVTRRIPVVSAAVVDARDGVGGFVLTWIPSVPNLACPACFLDDQATPNRDESLLAPVTSMVASLAAWSVVGLLAAGRRFRIGENCIAVDLRAMTLDAFRTLRRADCRTCAREQVQSKPRPRR